MKYPILILLISYVSGILFFKFNSSWLFLAFLLFLILLSLFQLKRLSTSLFIVPLILILFFSGYSASINKYNLQKTYFSEYNNSKVIVVGKILNIQENKAQNLVKIWAKVESVNNFKFDKPLNISLTGDSGVLNSDIVYGDKLRVLCKLNIPESPKFYSDSDLNIYNLSRNIYATGYVIDLISSEHTKISGLWSYINFLAFQIRKYINNAVNKYLSPQNSGIFLSILLGDRSNLPSDIRESMSISGITHITVIAGLHVNIILGNLELLLQWSRLRKQIRNFLMMLAAILLLIIIGPTIPVSRAVIMAVLSYLSFFFIRKSSSWNNLLITALIILIYNPICLFDIAFQLSFITTGGIIFLGDYIRSFFNKISRAKNIKNRLAKISVNYLFENMSISFSANLAVFPLTIYYLNQISLIFWLINLIITIPVHITIISGILMVITPKFISFMLAKMVSLCLDFIVMTSKWGESLRILIFKFSSPNWIFFVIYYIILLIAYHFVKRNRMLNNEKYE